MNIKRNEGKIWKLETQKAIILDGGKILLTKNQDDERYFFLCPGGQEHGETFHTTLKRECIEEIGLNIDIKELLHIREYIGKNHEYAEFDFYVHQIEYYFLCQLSRTETPIKPTNPDNHQVGVEWIRIEDLLNYRLYPKELRKYIIGYFNGENLPVYLGDIN